MLHELAMLFCHAGSDVFFAISDESVAWLTPEQATAYTGNQPFTSTNRPSWLKSKHPFEIAVVFSDFFSTPASFASELVARSLQIDILTRDVNFTFSSISCRPRCWRLPATDADLQSFYQQLFSRLMRRMAGKAQTERIRVFFSEKLHSKNAESVESVAGSFLPGPANSSPMKALIDPRETTHIDEKSINFYIADRLRLAMFDAGFSFSENLAESDIVFGLTEEFSFNDKFVVEVAESRAQVLSTGVNSPRHLRIMADHDYITVRTHANTRVIPSIGQQNCYDRLADLILFKASSSLGLS